MASNAKTSQKDIKRPAHRTAQAPPKVKSFDIADSADVLALANDLKKFIADNELSTTVQGKNFVNVEGWQYAGSRLGIVPVVEHVINVSSPEELKYQAKVTLFDLRHNTTVGAGFATCSNKESGKKFYQEFAIMSMAQTRATGKAFRNVLAYLIRAAGYEATPAEEMDYDTNKPAPAAALPAAPAAEQLPAEEGAASKKETAGAGAPDSAPLAVSIGAAQSSEEREQLIAQLRERIAAAMSVDELLALWKGDAKRFQAELRDDKDAAKLRLDNATAAAIAKAAETNAPAITPEQIPAPARVAGDPIEYATKEQREEIIRLLNHPKTQRPEKTKLLININRLAAAPTKGHPHGDAPSIIAKLRHRIELREAGISESSTAGVLKDFIQRNTKTLGKEACSRFAMVAYSPHSTEEELRDAYAEAVTLAATSEASEEPEEAELTKAA